MADLGHGKDYKFNKNVEVETGKFITYETHPTFSADTQLIDKKYYDDNLIASNVDIDQIGIPSYQTVQDFINISQGASVWSGFTISDGGSGTVDIGSGTGLIKSTNSGVGPNFSFDFGGSSGLSLADNNTNYIYVDYNAGTPFIAANVSISAINLRTQIVIGRVYRSGSSVSILGVGQFFEEYQTKDCLRSFEVDGFQRASGEILGETGTRNITVTAGVDYCAHNRFTTPAIDTSGSDTYDVWNSSASVTPDTTGVTQVDNANYWNGASLVALTTNRYGTRFFYRAFDGTIHMQYGTSNSVSIAGALNEPVPITPVFLRDFSLYIGRIVIQEGDAVFTEITNPFETPEEGSSVVSHNELAGLTNDDHPQYAFLSGRSLGQTLIGGTASSENLTLESTSDATKGKVVLKDDVTVGDGAATDKTITFDSGTADGFITWIDSTSAFKFGTGLEYLQVDLEPTVTNLETYNATTVYRGAPSPSVTTFRVQGSGASNARYELMRGDDTNAWTRWQQLATSCQISYGDSTTQHIFNASNKNIDFKIRGQSDVNLINTDAANNRVGIGVVPTVKFQVGGDAKISSGTFSLPTGTTVNEISTDSTLASATDDQLVTAKVVKDHIVTPSLDNVFHAYLNTAATSVTGDGTPYTVVFDTEVLDRGSNYNTSNGEFTPPSAGFYQLTSYIELTDLASGHTKAIIEFNGANPSEVDIFRGDPYSCSDKTNDVFGITGTFYGWLTTSPVIKITVTVFNGAKAVGIGRYSSFSGRLIGI
jgi:hypothetical protein